jgi:hypothetical protein
MKIQTSNAIASALICVLAATFVAGCEKKNASGVAAPGIEETKAIAEEGFIYGLPIVMNYAVMYEYAVDKTGSQFKAPFNQINDEARVFTYKDTAIDTPIATRLIRYCGWTCAPNPSCCRSPRSKGRATTRSCSATAIPSTTDT